MKQLNIIYRVCDRVTAASGLNRPRPFGTKLEVIKKCFKSLNDSIKYYNNECNLIVVADHISMELEEYIKSFDIINKYIPLENSGNGNSFLKCINEGLKHKGLIFFLEDDYLLEPSCLNEMVKFYELCEKNNRFEQKHICLYPTDYPDRYIKLKPCNILLGHNVHWRTIDSTTCTFLIDDYILNDQYNNLKRFENWGKDPNITEDNTINLMYKKYYCFSPIPSLGEHLQYYNTLSPFSKQNKKIKLPNITLAIIDCKNEEQSIYAIEQSTKEFEFAKIKYFTSIETNNQYKIKIPHIDSKEKYSLFCIKELNNYIDTDFVLIIQHDGFIIGNKESWCNEFTNYDYIGAPWWYNDGFNVGNGGFSLRSKKLLNALKDDNVKIFHPEDHCICRIYRKLLEDKGIKFAPESLAHKFSIEHNNKYGQKYEGQLGFHGPNIIR